MLRGLRTQVVIRKVNEDIDVPFISERREGRIIEKFVDRINPKVEPSMRAIMPDVYVRYECRGYVSFTSEHELLVLGGESPYVVEGRAASELLTRATVAVKRLEKFLPCSLVACVIWSPLNVPHSEEFWRRGYGGKCVRKWLFGTTTS